MKEVLGRHRVQTLKSNVITNFLTFVYIKLETKKGQRCTYFQHKTKHFLF